MKIEGIGMLPKLITSTDDLSGSFTEMFSCSEAKAEKGIVYFFMSEKPIPRIRGESNILYIGKTVQSLHKRYARYCEKLAANRSGNFYRYVIENYGGISVGYVAVDNPKAAESAFFKKYHEKYLEFPPKSKVG